jgi:hypothetical protein
MLSSSFSQLRFHSIPRIAVALVLCLALAGCLASSRSQQAAPSAPRVASQAPSPPASPSTPASTSSRDEARLVVAVRDALTKPAPAGYAAIPTGTSLRAARVQGSRVTLDFNKALLAGGTGRVLEDALRQISNAIDPITRDISALDLRIEIEGVPLEQLR